MSRQKQQQQQHPIDFDDPYIKLACGGLNKHELGVDETRLLRHMVKGPILDTDEESTVARFYDNRSVFITGATGFIGKALVEKLIRSCVNIRYVYILVREKKNKSVAERLADLLDSKIFMRICHTKPNGRTLLESKVRVVSGDINLPMFGVSDEQMQELNENVSVVFNSAATIKFSEPLENAVQNNIVSVQNLVEFCRKLTKLDALVHLSTAYSNCHKKDEIFEILYEPPMHGADIIKLVQRLRVGEAAISSCAQEYDINADLDDNPRATQFEQHSFESSPKPMSSSRSESLSQAFTRHAMHKSNRPNTYTLTKSIAEFFLCEQVAKHPETFAGDDGVAIAIVRPSVVGCSNREPIPGYADNFNGPSSSISFTQIGALQIMPVAGKKIADFVPLDMIVNFLVCCGWFLAEDRVQRRRKRDNSLPEPAVKVPPLIKDKGVYVFNYVSGKSNPLFWRLLASNTVKFGYLFPGTQTTRLPCMTYYPHGKLFVLVDLINQKFPAYLLDKYSQWTAKRKPPVNEPPKTRPRPSALSVYNSLKLMTEALLPFSMNQWRIDDANTRAVLNALPEPDKHLFDFDIKHVDWNEYLRTYNLGARVFLHRDSVASLAKSKTKLKIRQAIYLAFVLLVALAIELYFR